MNFKQLLIVGAVIAAPLVASPASAAHSGSIQERVKAVTAEALKINESDIYPEASLIDNLGADEFEFVELKLAIEDEFELAFTSEEFQKVMYFHQLVSLVSKYIR